MSQRYGITVKFLISADSPEEAEEIIESACEKAAASMGEGDVSYEGTTTLKQPVRRPVTREYSAEFISRQNRISLSFWGYRRTCITSRTGWRILPLNVPKAAKSFSKLSNNWR